MWQILLNFASDINTINTEFCDKIYSVKSKFISRNQRGMNVTDEYYYHHHYVMNHHTTYYEVYLFLVRTYYVQIRMCPAAVLVVLLFRDPHLLDGEVESDWARGCTQE